MPAKAKGASSRRQAFHKPMSWRRKTVWFTNRLLIGITLLAYACTLVPPGLFWPAAFVAYAIPGFIALNFFYMYLWYYKSRVFMLYSLGCIVVGYPFLTATLAINLPKAPKENSVSVLSYNVRVFNVYNTYNKGAEEKEVAKKMIDWVFQDQSDIKCLQEFYSKDKSELFDIRRRIKKEGKYNLFVAGSKARGQDFGLAIMSKYPIVHSGLIDFEQSDNSAAFADIALPADTLRIINVHLESLHLRAEQLESTESIKENSKNIFERLKKAFVRRSKQLNVIEKYIKESPHPVILCGDINDLPYSYTYMTLSGWLDSSFEDASNGFGFTYNSGPLFFLRIDHQFYSNGVEALQCNTLRDVDYSDHFPIHAVYQFNGE